VNRELLDRHVVRPAPDEVVYIASQRVQLGDVLLTRGRSSLSKAVLVGTGGRFSHAALFVGSSLYDAVEVRGTGRTVLEHVSLDLRYSLKRGLVDRSYGLRLPPEDEYLWLRHPKVFSTFEETELEKALYGVASFVRYPNPSALASLLPVPEVVRRLVASATEWMEGLFGLTREESGIFCSQLIALFFECARVELFDPPRGDKVTPDDLVDSELQPVDGALMCAPRDEVVASPRGEHARALEASASDEATIRERERMERLREINKATRRGSAHPTDLPAQLADLMAAREAAEELTRIGQEFIREQLEMLKRERAMLKDFRESESARECERYLGSDFGLVADVVPQQDASDGAPLTAGPNAGAKLLRQLERGTVVRTHVHDTDRWRVRLEDGTEGYVPKRHLRVRPPARS
jgi:hypothetical protein